MDEHGRIVGVEVLNADNPLDMLSRLGVLLEYCKIAD